MDNAPFYDSGLYFSCKRCSACCRYDSGFVYLSENDILKLTAALEMERNALINKYCRWVPDWQGNEVLSLREKNNNDCILWENGCIVYNARPLQCVTFPFWESVVVSAHAWAMAASGCPGMNSGELHTKSEIDEKINKHICDSIINKKGIEVKVKI